MPVTGMVFRHTLSHLASGVTVLVARDAGGNAHGMTASAVTSLSLDPPMILVCVDRSAAIHPLVVSAETFGLNVLARAQEAVAVRFADRDRHAWTEVVVERSPGGLPLVPGALARLEIRRGPVYEGGDHSIITGTVEWADSREGEPLCYFRSRYTGVDS
jgi:flavin reductase (DIM6/NTAB) family NADH-FMN oxidoreductase RutF